MNIYKVHESMIDGLKKKAAAIGKKCARYGCEFHFEIIGDEYVEVSGYGLQKFFIVSAEGTARINGWKFVATIQHEATGNVVRKALTELEVPERYWHTKPVCEHCDTHRARKNTFLVYNETTGEYKQVGKACLKDYTGGMSAEWAAFMASIADIFEENCGSGACGIRYENHYIEPEKLLAYAASAVDRCGYVKKYSDTEDGGREYNANNTAELVQEIFTNDIRHQKNPRKEATGIDENDPHAVETASAALEWLFSQDNDSDYFRNLRVVASMEYIGASHIGIMVSLIPAYLRAMDKAIKAEEKKNTSEHVGTVGKRLDIHVKEYKVLKSWKNDFGSLVIFYRFTDCDGNIFIWKSAGIFGFIDAEGYIYHPDFDEPFLMRATVKEHSEFNGQKQTVLTRCKIIALEKEEK
jgi:hypothetical protein